MLCPSSLELRVRRLRWPQAMIKFPIEHELPVSALFGTMQREENCGHAATLTSGGRVHHSANPWAKMFEDDVHSLFDVSGCETFDSIWDRSLYSLFGDEEVGEAFCILDPGILRAKFWSSSVAPPEYDMVGPDPVPDTGTSLDPLYECDLLLEMGCKCDARFATYKGLRTHQIKSHGIRNTARLAIVTNQCPICSSTFKSEACAKQHLQYAMVHHRCYAGRSSVEIPVRQPADLTCPF